MQWPSTLFHGHSSYWVFAGDNVSLKIYEVSVSIKKNLWKFVPDFDEAEV